jgi:hypothetical protein
MTMNSSDVQFILLPVMLHPRRPALRQRKPTMSHSPSGTFQEWPRISQYILCS